VKPIRYYNQIEKLSGADCATGQASRSSQQVRRCLQTLSFTVNLNEEDMQYIPEPPPFDLVPEEPLPSPPIVDLYSPVVIESVPSTPSSGMPSSKGSKRKLLWLMLLMHNLRI